MQNIQRQNFQKQMTAAKPKGGASQQPTQGDGKMESRIEHHDDGTHTVHHHDGETSGPHPTMAHAAMHMAGKHDGGEHGHITPHHGGGAVTHHVSMDGEVQGPMEHESEDEAYSHLKGSIGEGSDMSGEGPQMGGDQESTFE